MNRIATLMIGAALAATTALAAPPTPPDTPGRPGPGMRGPGLPPQLATVLGLTDDQKATLEAMHKEQMEATRPLFEKSRTLQREMETLLDSGKADPAAVGKKAMELHAVRKQLREAHEGMQQKLESILTPEQKLKFEGFRAAMPHGGPGGPDGPRGHGMRGPGGPGMPPPPPEGPDGAPVPPPAPEE